MPPPFAIRDLLPDATLAFSNYSRLHPGRPHRRPTMALPPGKTDWEVHRGFRTRITKVALTGTFGRDAIDNSYCRFCLVVGLRYNVNNRPMVLHV